MRLWPKTLILLLLACGSAAAQPRSQAPKAWLGFGYTLHNFGSQAPIRQWLYVERVAPESPAMVGGMRVQDAIVAINGRAVSFASAAAALQYFASIKPGTVLRFDLIRQEKRISLTVRAQPMPEKYAATHWMRNEALAQQEDARTGAKARQKTSRPKGE